MEAVQNAPKVSDVFQTMEPGQFRHEFQKLWNAGERLADTVIDLVEDGQLTPALGLTVIGASVEVILGIHDHDGGAIELVDSLRARASQQR